MVNISAGKCHGAFSYGFSFVDINGNTQMKNGYISKLGMYEDMKTLGATEEQIREAKKQAKLIKKANY